MEKKLIVFDLDETLRKLEFDNDYNEIRNVYLRPNIGKLLEKLKEVKKQGIDIMIWTTASSESAQRYFIDCLPEEYRDLFCRVISRDNKMKLEDGSMEEKVYGYNTSNKPVTAIEGYNQILFFDDNETESMYLKNMYRDNENSPEKQVIFASYRYDLQKPYVLYGYKKISKISKRVAERLNEYLKKLLEEPGCSLMIEKIDEFQKSEFVKGLTIDTGEEKMKQNRDEASDIEEEIEDIIDEDRELSKKYEEFMEEYLLLNSKRPDVVGDVR